MTTETAPAPPTGGQDVTNVEVDAAPLRLAEVHAKLAVAASRVMATWAAELDRQLKQA